MNKERRAALAKALELVEEAKAILEEAASEEQDYYDNMPEGLQGGEKGDNAQTAIDALENAVNSCDEIVAGIEEATQ
jgi:hypothetical protein